MIKNKIIYFVIAIVCCIKSNSFAQAGKLNNNTILLDGYFNHETIKDSTGNIIQTHYLWDETDNGGFSLLAAIFHSHDIQTRLLTSAVSASDLSKASFYFIVDPDCPKENPSPHYIMPEHINTIHNWVKEGGILLLFSNDSGNVEFTHFNQLAEKFGIHFNEHHSRNKVINDHFQTGTIDIPAGNEIFTSARNIFIKDICTLQLKPPAKAILTAGNDIIIAVSKIGKGTVFAIGDPWLYNEYLDEKKLPKEIENKKAAEDLVKWLLDQTNK